MNATRVDLCVVGAGLAGLTAAVFAAKAGLKVAVLERSATRDYLCNSRMTGGAFHVCLHDILTESSALAEVIRKSTSGHAEPGLARAVAADARRAVRWLQSLGVRFIKGGAEAHHNFVLSPPSLQRVGADWRGRGGDVLLRTLTQALEQNGGQLHLGHRAIELQVDERGCHGLRARVGETEVAFECAATVIADGGFQCDTKLLRENISADPAALLQRNALSGHGDGLRMAQRAGALLSDLRGFYGHVMHRNALHDARLWPLPWMDNVATAAIVVDTSGRRIDDEGRGGVFIANRIAALPDPLSAFVVFDQAIWDGPGTSRFHPPNPHMERCGGPVIRADSVAALAKAAGIDPSGLAATVEQYNRHLSGDGADALNPPRTVDHYPAMPVRIAPFMAVPVCAGITYTMGGIAIDASARALKQDGTPFPGLYAAGGSSGGLEGGADVGYVGGLAKAATTGLLAAEHIVNVLMPSRA